MLYDTYDSALGVQARTDASTGNAETPQGQGEVSRLLSVIADQIAEADRRHCEALSDMKMRLQQLGSDTRVARPQVPHEFAPAFARIEDALTQLAERITETRAERATGVAAHNDTHFHEEQLAAFAPPPQPVSAPSPMALRSASNPPAGQSYNWASDFTRTRADSLAADPFDIVDMGGTPITADTWSAGEAEALTRIYEDDAAAPPVMAAMPPLVTQSFVPPPFVSEPAVPQPAVAFAPTSHVAQADPMMNAAVSYAMRPAIEASTFAGRQWLEDQFAELAERLQASLNGTQAHEMLSALDTRLIEIEKHLGVSLQNVASRSDVEGLKLVEAHIEEMTRHLDQTQGQLGRLDNIEAQLNEVVEHLAAQFETRSTQAAPMAAGDVQRIASEAAETVASRFAGSMASAPAAANDDQIESMRGLLESYINERRDGDEHSALMLDTMQQALIRVLDRIDAMENAQIAPVFAPLAPAVQAAAVQHVMPQPAMPQTAAPQPATHVQRQRDAFDDARVAGQEAPEDNPFDMVPGETIAEAYEPAVTFAPGQEYKRPQAPEEPPVEDRTGVKKLRQDMIADAQRAKQRAAAAQAASAAGEVPDAKGKARIAVSAPQAGATGSSSKLRVALMAVLLAVLGGAAAMKMLGPQPAPMPMPMERSDTAAPAAAAPAVKSPDMTPAVKPQAAVPTVKPSVDANVNGMVFEADPSDALVPAPGKISHDGDLPELPGMRLRQSSETMSAGNLAILQHQQNIAQLSSQLGEAASNIATPAAFMKEVPITALSPANAMPAQPGTISAASAVTGVKSSALDLPPVTVGPLSLRLAAAKGDPSAEFEAASRLAEGKGTSQNFKEALRWYQRSAAQGFAQAQYRLGTLYERGLGIKADTGTARSWYQRAAEQGNVKAMHNLAVLSANRQGGSPDYATAAQWFTSAAERDLQDSQYNLGVLYESGMGVEKDMKQAMKWYSLAARGGDAEATRRRDTLKAQLAPQDLAQVSNSVAAFQAVRVENPLINDARAAGEDWKKRMDGQEQG